MRRNRSCDAHNGTSYLTLAVAGLCATSGYGTAEAIYNIAHSTCSNRSPGSLKNAGTSASRRTSCASALPELPCTQMSIAMAFLRDRGCVDVQGRRSYGASWCITEDAMTEFHYLAHSAGGAK